MCSPAAFHCSCILKPFLLHCEVAWQSISFDHFANTLPRLFFSPIEISSQAWLCDVLAKWPTLIGWSVYAMTWMLAIVYHKESRPAETGKKELPPLRINCMFLLPCRSFSGCCGPCLIPAAGTEIKEGMCFCINSPKFWAWTACCFNIKN